MTETTEVRGILFVMRGTDRLNCDAVGIRKATAWYNSHISLARPPVRGQAAPVLPDVLLLTDDAANREKAEKEGIKCLSGTHTTRTYM